MNTNVCRKCGAVLPDGAIFCPMCGRKQTVERRSRARGNGTGTAYRRGQTWTGQRPGYSYIQIADDGTVHRIRKRPTKGGFKTKKEALLWASQESKDEIVVPKLIDLWKNYSENGMTKLSDDKQAAYKIARKRLEPLMHRKIDALTVEDLQNVINTKCTSHYTAKDVRDLLSNLYKLAMASNHSPVNQNLSKHLVLPDLDEKEPEPFTEEEVNAIWAVYNQGDVVAGFILLMIYTGLMPGELLALKKDMIDLDGLEIRGAGKKTKVRKKAVVVFPAFLRPVIESLLAFNDEDEGDKLYPRGKHRFYELYYAVLERAGVRRLPPYSCRHTFGTEIVKAGMHPAMIQKLLRHANQKTQEKYTHLSAKDEHAAVGLWLTNGLQNPSEH